jgi:hypothetical protein
MSELHIPDAALQAARRLADEGGPDDLPSQLHASAPYIVAAELRRLADEMELEITTLEPSDLLGSAAAGGVRVAIAALRGRANGLDGVS